MAAGNVYDWNKAAMVAVSGSQFGSGVQAACWLTMLLPLSLCLLSFLLDHGLLRKPSSTIILNYPCYQDSYDRNQICLGDIHGVPGAAITRCPVLSG